jgi:hypothetical protein
LNTIFIVTHGEKFPGKNPEMTEDGFKQVAALRPLLPEVISAVVCGTGKRHLDVAVALSLEPTRYTLNVGGPESLEKIDGKLCVVLADGTAVPRDLYTGTDDGKAAMASVVLSLSDGAVICAGRPSMILLGVNDAKGAAVYAVEVKDGKIVAIHEITALGVSEARTV